MTQATHHRPADHPTFDFESLLGAYRNRAFLTVPECCFILRRKKTFVLGLLDDGTLHGHSAGADRVKDRKRVTTRSLALYLVESALYGGPDYAARVRDLFSTWTPRQRAEAIAELSRMPHDRD